MEIVSKTKILFKFHSYKYQKFIRKRKILLMISEPQANLKY